MLLNLLDGWFKINLGEGAFYAVFGFLFVFLGIALLIGIFTVLGIVMKKFNARKPTPNTKQKLEKKPHADKADKRALLLAEEASEEGISKELVAVISAAVAAYCGQNAQNCDFVVRRIKRL